MEVTLELLYVFLSMVTAHCKSVDDLTVEDTVLPNLYGSASLLVLYQPAINTCIETQASNGAVEVHVELECKSYRCIWLANVDRHHHRTCRALQGSRQVLSGWSGLNGARTQLGTRSRVGPRTWPERTLF